MAWFKTKTLRDGSQAWYLAWRAGPRIHTEKVAVTPPRTSPPKEARLRKAEVESRLARSPFAAVRLPKKTLEEFAAEWSAGRHAEAAEDIGRLSPKTVYEEDRLLRKHVLAEFGSFQLGRITPADVERFLLRLSSESSPWIARQVRITLRKMLADARRLRYILDNPVADTKPIAPRGKERPIWDIEQTKLFLGEAKRYAAESGRSYLYPLFLFLVMAGARPGEALALRRQDVNLSLGFADIERNLLRVSPPKTEAQSNGHRARVIFKAPKTEAGRRRVELGPLVVEELRRHLDGHSHELVFCQPDGKPLHEHNLAQRDFRRVTNLEGLRKELPDLKPLPRIRLYDLRHLHSSLGAFLGVAPKVMQERLGHASPAITLAVYTHTMGNAHRAAAVMFEEAILAQANGERPESA